MTNITMKTIIRLRKDSYSNYDKIKDTFIPANGEVCLIDTDNGIRVKVGDGSTTFANLEYIDQDLRNAVNNNIIRGYYFNKKFYTDSTYTTEVEKSVKSIYIDESTNTIFNFDGTNYHGINDLLPTATDAVAGIAKLYGTSGQNTDGSMTQKAITDGVSAIQFKLADDTEECLELDLPWD